MDAFNTFDGAGNTAFDFTLLFEQRILSLLPSLIVLVLALLRLYALRTEPRRVQGRVLQAFKLVRLLHVTLPYVLLTCNTFSARL